MDNVYRHVHGYVYGRCARTCAWTCAWICVSDVCIRHVQRHAYGHAYRDVDMCVHMCMDMCIHVRRLRCGETLRHAATRAYFGAIKKESCSFGAITKELWTVFDAIKKNDDLPADPTSSGHRLYMDMRLDMCVRIDIGIPCL